MSLRGLRWLLLAAGLAGCPGAEDGGEAEDTSPHVAPLALRGVAVQTGTTTSTAAGTVTATMAPVDPSRAFLLFATRSESDRPVGTTVSGVLADGTTLAFTRVTDELVPVPIAIRWFVVEYASGVRVQRGQVAQTATTIDVPVSPVGSLAQAFVTASKACKADDGGWNDDDAVVVDLTAPDNLQVRVATATPLHVIAWQVIEFTDPSWVRVQRGSLALSGGALAAEATLASPVDPAKTIVLASLRSPAGTNDVGARLVTAELGDATHVRIRRDAPGDADDLPEVHFQVIELREGSHVQHGIATLDANAASEEIRLDAIDPSKSVAILSGESGAGEAMGRTPYIDNDVAGVALATPTLTTDTLTLERASTLAPATFSWFAIELGPTCGNGVVEGDEACDGSTCCAPDCTPGNAGAVCREAAGMCDAEERCDGVSGECPADLGPGTCGEGPGMPGDPGGGENDPGAGGGAADDGDSTSALACALSPASGGHARRGLLLLLMAVAALAVGRRARMTRAEGCRSRSDSSGRDPEPAAPTRSNTRSCASPSPSPRGTPNGPPG